MTQKCPQLHESRESRLILKVDLLPKIIVDEMKLSIFL